MKKVLVLILCISILFISCEQNKSPNGATAPTENFSQNEAVVGYALSNLSKDGLIVSDLFGIKIGQNYIDDVGNLSISGEQISELFDKDDFLDNLVDVKIDNIENCNVYLINNATIIKGTIEQTDVFFEHGTGEFFIKIYSSFSEEILIDCTNKYLCVLTEKNIEIQTLDYATHCNVVKSPMGKTDYDSDDESQISLFNLLKIDDEVFTVWLHKWSYAEMYSINNQNGDTLLELWYSEP